MMSAGRGCSVPAVGSLRSTCSGARAAAAFAAVAVLATAVVFASPGADAGAQQLANPAPNIPQKVWNAVAAGEPVEVVVMTDDVVGMAAARTDLDSALGAMAELEVLHEFEVIPAVTTMVTSTEQLEELAADSRVRAVDLGRQRATLDLQESVALTGAGVSHAAGVRGAGTTVAIIDSGIDANHPDLKSSIVYQACFIDNNPQAPGGNCPNGQASQFGSGAAPDTVNSHGTLVAGVISSAGVLAPPGIAPDSSLEVYKVFGDGYSSDLMRALEHIAADRPDVDVVNMSFSFNDVDSTGLCDSQFPALVAMIDQVRANGAVVVASSGNLGLNNRVQAPACFSNVIAVGSYGDAASSPTFEQVTDFTNVSAELDLVAPGTSVETTTTGSTVGFFGGTSVAAATVSGCAALIVESGVRGASNIERRLRTTSRVAQNPRGRNVPIVDCAVSSAPAASGDVNCDNRADVIDALFISQYEVQTRTNTGQCPLSSPSTQININGADVTADGQINVVDSLFIAQCAAAVPNSFCPDI